MSALAIAFLAGGCAPSETRPPPKVALPLSSVATGLERFGGLMLFTPNRMVILDIGAPTQLKWYEGGRLVRAGGRVGDGPGELRRPRSLVPVDDSTFAILGYTGQSVQLFHSDGRFLARLRFLDGPFMVAGELFPGGLGETWLIEDGTPSHVRPAHSDSFPVWKLRPETGHAHQWAMATGGGRGERTTPTGSVSVPIPLWSGDLLVALGVDSVIVLDPRAASLRLLVKGETLRHTKIAGLTRLPVPSAVRDSISRRWKNHPNRAFRGMFFDLPMEYAAFDQATRGNPNVIWLRVAVSSNETRYELVDWLTGALLGRALFPGDVQIIDIRADSVLSLVEGDDGSSLQWFRLPSVVDQ